LQRIGNDAAANENLIGCAHKYLAAKWHMRIFHRDFASVT
jgi:hypothetical protein